MVKAPSRKNDLIYTSTLTWMRTPKTGAVSLGLCFSVTVAQLYLSLDLLPKAEVWTWDPWDPRVEFLGVCGLGWRKKKNHIFIFIISLQLKCSSSFHHECRPQIPVVLPVPVTSAVPSSTEITDVLMPHYRCCRSPKILFMLMSASKLQ